MPVLAASLLILVFVGRVQELFPVLAPLRLGLVALVLNALVLLATLDLSDLRFKMRILPQPRLLLVILGLALLTVPFSVWPGGSWRFILDSYLKNVFAFFVLLLVMKDERDIRGIVFAVLLSVFLLGTLGMLGHAGGRLQISSTYDPNDIAYVMNCFIPLAFYLSRSGGKLLMACCFVMMGLMVVVVISTASRGGFISLASIFAVILLKERQKKLKIIVFSIFVGLLALSFSGPEYWQRMGTILDQNDYNYQAGGGRIEIWKRGVGMILDNPLIGAGMGQYQVAEGLLHEGQGGWKWSTAHNSYLQIGVELALPGLIVYLMMLAKSIVVARKIQSTPSPFDASPFLLATASGVEVGFYGYCISSIFLSQAYSSVLLYFLALITALYAILLRLQTPEDQELVQSNNRPKSSLRKPYA
jgi:O-antigen ligase